MGLIRRLTFVIAALSVVGCSTTQSISPRPQNAVAFAPWTDAPVDYRVGSGDKVKVGFLLTPELDQDVTVAPDGSVSLKVIGRVAAANLSLDQLAAAIQDAAQTSLRNPVVTVGVVEAPSARVIVGGAVAKPGVYPLSARSSPLEMVMMAGGLLPESRMTEVVVVRRRPDNLMMMRTVDLNSFIARADPAGSLALAPEDIIFVPRNRGAEVNLWIEQNINRMLPFTRSIGYTWNRNGVVAR